MKLYERLSDFKYEQYDTPQEFLAVAIEYFEYCDEFPIQTEELFPYQGNVTREFSNKLRAYTKQGLAVFAKIPVKRLEGYRNREDEDWQMVMEMIDQVMFDQKFTAAAAGILNANLISRDLGLAEKNELSGPNGGPVQTVTQYQLPDNGRDSE